MSSQQLVSHITTLLYVCWLPVAALMLTVGADSMRMRCEKRISNFLVFQVKDNGGGVLLLDLLLKILNNFLKAKKLASVIAMLNALSDFD